MKINSERKQNWDIKPEVSTRYDFECQFIALRRTTLNRGALSKAYASEYKQGYQYLGNMGTDKVDAKVAKLKAAGFETIAHEKAFDYKGNPLTEGSCKAILVRITPGKNLEDALKTYLDSEVK